jgi:hypothetical protein
MDAVPTEKQVARGQRGDEVLWTAWELPDGSFRVDTEDGSFAFRDHKKCKTFARRYSMMLDKRHSQRERQRRYESGAHEADMCDWEWRDLRLVPLLLIFILLLPFIWLYRKFGFMGEDR